MAEEIVDGRAHTVDVDAFSIDRFASVTSIPSTT
jgi:hypothetical protein